MQAAVMKDDQRPVYDRFAEPEAIDGAVVVKVLAAALTGLDKVVARRAHYVTMPEGPFVLGREGVARRSDGRRIYFNLNAPVAPFGSMAERALIDPRFAFPVPDGVADDTAAALGNAGLAAWLGLSWRGRMRPGETVLILGATGVSGLIAVTAAKRLGAGRVVAAGRNREALQRARRLGADGIVDACGGDGSRCRLPRCRLRRRRRGHGLCLRRAGRGGARGAGDLWPPGPHRDAGRARHDSARRDHAAELASTSWGSAITTRPSKSRRRPMRSCAALPPRAKSHWTSRRGRSRKSAPPGMRMPRAIAGVRCSISRLAQPACSLSMCASTAGMYRVPATASAGTACSMRARSPGDSFTSSAPSASLSWSRRRAPISGTTSSPRDFTQAKASCAVVAFFLVRDIAERLDQRDVFLEVFFEETRLAGADFARRGPAPPRRGR